MEWMLTEDEIYDTDVEAFDLEENRVDIPLSELNKVAQAQAKKLVEWLENYPYHHEARGNKELHIPWGEWQELRRQVGLE